MVLFSVLKKRGVLAPPQPINVLFVPSSIDSTGGSAVADDLNDWFTTTDFSSVDIVRFQPDGEYNIGSGGEFTLTGIDNLNVDLNGAALSRNTLLAQPQRYPNGTKTVRIEDCNNLSFYNGSIFGMNVNDEAIFGAHKDGFTHGGPAGYVEITPPTPGYEDLVYFPTNDLAWGEHVPGGTDIDPITPFREGFKINRWYLLGSNGQWTPWGPASVPADRDPDFGSYTVALDFEHGVHVQGGRDVLVEDLSIIGPGGDYVYGHSVENCTFRRIYGRRNGRQGCAFITGGPYLFVDSDITSRRSAVDFEADVGSHHIQSATVRRCTVETSQMLAFANFGPGTADKITIDDNDIIKSGTPFIHAASTKAPLSVETNSSRPEGYYPRTNYVITNNRIHSGINGGYPTIRLDNIDGVLIKGNTLKRDGGSGSVVGSVTWPSKNVVIEDNECDGYQASADIYKDRAGFAAENTKWDWASGQHEDSEGTIHPGESSNIRASGNTPSRFNILDSGGTFAPTFEETF